jgi:hypothetical protein
MGGCRLIGTLPARIRSMNTTTETAEFAAGTAVHPFELAGLGKAPFRYVGMEEKVHNNGDGTTKAGSCCDYCCASIRYVFWVVSADGRRFKTGCDCIHKVNDARLIKVIAKDEAKLAKAKRDAKRAKDVARVAAAKARLPQVADALAARPHPRGFVNRETGAPMTLLDWATWMLDNAGVTGGLTVAKIIEAA